MAVRGYSRRSQAFWYGRVCKGPDLSLSSKEKQQAIATGTEDEKNLALADGKPRTSMDSDGQKAEKEVYSGTLKKTLFKAKNAGFAAKKQALKKTVGE